MSKHKIVEQSTILKHEVQEAPGRSLACQGSFLQRWPWKYIQERDFSSFPPNKTAGIHRKSRVRDKLREQGLSEGLEGAMSMEVQVVY